MRLTGGCLCGAVRYVADEPLAGPTSSYYCHCKMCQKLSGSAFVVGVKARKKSFRFTRGEAKVFKTSEICERGFCADCGSRLFYRPFETDWLGIDTGSLDEPDHWPPNYHSGVESQMPWLIIEDQLPRMRTDDNPRVMALKEGADQKKPRGVLDNNGQ